MKDDKICFPKTLTYLVLLVAALIGGFYIMNYVNNSRLTSDSEAAGACRNAQGVKGITIKSTRACGDLNTAKDTYKESIDYEVEGFRCCMSQRQPNVYQGSEEKSTCQVKKNKIAERFNNGSCTYYTGEVSSQGRCKVGVSADKIECEGIELINRNVYLKSACGDIKGAIKGDAKIAGNGNRTCLVYSGGFKQSGNFESWIDYCLAEDEIDINITADKGQSAAYKTDNCW